MDLNRYSKLFDEHVLELEKEAETRMNAFREKCVQDFINRLTRHQDEWDASFRWLLQKSQEEIPEFKNVTFAEKPVIRLIDKEQAPIEVKPVEKPPEILFQERIAQQQEQQAAARRELEEKAKLLQTPVESETKAPSTKQATVGGDILGPPDPFPKGTEDYFTNNLAVKEFIRIQEHQEKNRQLFHEFNTSAALKPFKNEVSLFVRSQINSISNSDLNHMSAKVRLLSDFFLGQPVIFQNRQICAAKYPQGTMFALDLAAQTFVTVGTKLVNSVPAIARSMATVINGIVNHLPIFKDLIIGHLQELCPYLVPMYPQKADATTGLSQYQAEERHKIACGYRMDSSTSKLESEDKYLARMRSMALIFACVIIQQDNKAHAWGWLASFLSLKPESMVTATILQAFQQETSRTMSLVYRSQYKKLLAFMQMDYVKMLEKVTDQPSARQPLIKLKNQLSEDYNSAL